MPVDRTAPLMSVATGLLSILRTGVAITDKVTKSVQADVTYQRFLGDDAYGSPSYAPPVTMQALCDWRQQQVRTTTGVLTVSRTVITFLDINQLRSATDGKGIGDEDIITLPDGTTGPILDMSGFIDAGTGNPLATEVYQG